MLFPVEEEHTILLDWISFNTQNPGKRIMWAPLIQGNQERRRQDVFYRVNATFIRTKECIPRQYSYASRFKILQPGHTDMH